MKHSHRLPAFPDPLPPRFLSSVIGFADLFTRPTWPNVLILLAGVILTPGRRTIAAALRILGRERDPKFCTFHRILNRAAWSSRAAASRLLLLLTASFLPIAVPVVIGLDDTIERRWGPKISARGIYRDPVRSSKGHFVKASGLRWLSAMLLVPVPWADRIMALPFLTLLAPSKRFYAAKLRAPKTLVDWARQAALQIRRWLPDRYIVLVADSAFAAVEFLAAVRDHVCVVTRLRLDANLFAFPPPKRKGRGRPALKGKRLRKLSAVLKDRKIRWQRCRISLWYGRTDRMVEFTSRPGRGRRPRDPYRRSKGRFGAGSSGERRPHAAEPRSGIAPVFPQCRSAGSSFAIPKANSILKLSWQRILMPARRTSLPGSCAAGRSR